MRFHSGLQAVAYSCLVLAVPCAAPQDFGLTIGKHVVLESKILGEERDILVSAAQTAPGMPLLILLDGEWNFRTSGQRPGTELRRFKTGLINDRGLRQYASRE
jgi:hypothetical protein